MLALPTMMGLASLLLGHLTLATTSLTSITALPAPTGSYQVGRSVAELIDHKRTQPFAPHVEPRKLMVSVFYPVAAEHAPTLEKYMPFETARYEDVELASAGLESPNGTFESLFIPLAKKASAGSHDTCHFPVVLFMPAEGTTRLFYSLIASEVSSKGFTVVTIDTPYDVDIVEYPDGSVALLNETIAHNHNQTQKFLDAVLDVQVRAQDASFVLDSLSESKLAHKLIPGLPASGLNTSHVVMFGHSLGGAATLTAMGLDERIKGGIDMDGAFFGPAIEKGTDRPFMIMAHGNHTRKNSDPFHSWTKTWPNLTGWKRDIIIADTLHYDFSDLPVVFETLGIPLNQTFLTKAPFFVGTLKGTRALEIVTTYVTAFIDFVIHGEHSALLEGPVEEFPEVTFDE